MQGATELDEGFELGPVGEDRRVLLTTAPARGRGGRRGRGFRRIRICSLMNIIINQHYAELDVKENSTR